MIVTGGLDPEPDAADPDRPLSISDGPHQPIGATHRDRERDRLTHHSTLVIGNQGHRRVLADINGDHQTTLGRDASHSRQTIPVVCP